MPERAQPIINPGLVWRANCFAIALLETQRSIVFSMPMESKDYSVFIFPHNANLVVTEVNKTISGFIIDILISLSGDFNFLAVPYN